MVMPSWITPNYIQPHLYRCHKCEVCGSGDACWYCGSTEVKYGAYIPLRNAHRPYDPIVRFDGMTNQAIPAWPFTHPLLDEAGGP